MICIQSRNIITGLKLFQLFPRASYPTHLVFLQYCSFLWAPGASFSALNLYQAATLAQPVRLVQPLSSLSPV